MAVRTFKENRDYSWLSMDDQPWWNRLPIIRDYAQRAKLLRDYSFRHPRPGYSEVLVVPRGYIWNGASAGQAFRDTDDEKVMRASLVHDFCYDKEHRPEGCRRKDADQIFFDILGQDEAPCWFIQAAKLARDGGMFAHAWRNGIT